MSKYERMMAIEVEPARVFEYISHSQHRDTFTSLGGNTGGEAQVRVDADRHRIDWDISGNDPRYGAIWIRPGDITPELTEVTIELDYPNRPEDDPDGEDILESMRQALEDIRQHAR